MSRQIRCISNMEFDIDGTIKLRGHITELPTFLENLEKPKITIILSQKNI